MKVHVHSPGLLTTVQDAGRIGWRHLGVGRAGALDHYSHALANLLVGNQPASAALEITLAGPRLQFEGAARIALCGAPVDAKVDGEPIPGWRPVDLPAGSELAIGGFRRGARAYLAVAGGGLSVADVLDSAATDLRGGFGGFHGRALTAGDTLTVAGQPPVVEELSIANWWIDPAPDLDFSRLDAEALTTIHVLAGHDTTAPADALCDCPWRVAAASNRQGLRLEGPALQLEHNDQRISEPVAPGTIQLPADGQPIVLLADAQTHGGYPRIGHAIIADRPRLAQLRPGDRLRFVPCSPSQARELREQQAQRLARVALAIGARHPAR